MFGGVRLLAVTLLVLGFTAGPASAADYFVSPTGADANSGLSPAQAFRTIQKSADVVGPGDTVHLLAGTYDETVRLTESGTAGSPITFTTDGNPVVMDAQSRGCPLGKGVSSGAAQAFTATNVGHVVLDGIEITRYCYYGLAFEPGSHDITIRNLHVHHNGLTIRGNGGQGIVTEGVANVLIENNVVTDNVPRSGISGSGINVNEADQVIVRNNVVDRNNGNGILVEDGTNVLVEDNLARYNLGDFRSWGTSGIWVDGGHTITVRRNWLEGNVWDGIQITDETPSNPYSYEIYNNVIIGNWYGMRLAGIGQASQPPNLIYGNSFVDNTVAGIRFGGASSSQLTHTRLYGNLVAQIDTDQPALQVDQGVYPDVAVDDNLYYRQGAAKPISWHYSLGNPYDTTPRSVADRTFAEYQALSGWDASGLSADPLFVNTAAEDYHLLAGSPAIDAGSPLYFAPTDYDGHPRPLGSGPDIGALEGSGPCGVGACVAGDPGSRVYGSSIKKVGSQHVTIPSGAPSATKVVKVNVRNDDIHPRRDPLGHRIELMASDGNCPPGTVTGVPAFKQILWGPESSERPAGGKTVQPRVKLTIDRAAFAGVSHCTLQLTVKTPLPGSVDPLPSNDSAAVELYVNAL